MGTLEVFVPDIGDTEDAEIVEILVSAGDRVEPEDTLLSIESDKATLELPSPSAGVVESLAVKVGDRVEEGTLLLVLEVPEERSSDEDTAGAPAPEAPARDADRTTERTERTERTDRTEEAERTEAAEASEPAVADRPPGTPPPSRPPVPEYVAPSTGGPHASPLVRRQARELGVDLAKARGTGPHGRVLVEDVKAHVRSALAGGVSEAAASSAPSVDVDSLERFGPVRVVERERIRRTAARNLDQSWKTVPHVTQHDEADVTELEAFRRRQIERSGGEGPRLSLLPFIMKACVQALRRDPDFRSVLSDDGSRLYVRDSFHLGVAVDTEHGLLVPVVRDVDQKGLLELAAELASLAERARAKKLAPDDMQGAVFSISSLGGIGGTGFTPIVNWPQVAILGVSRSQHKPVWDAGSQAFSPRLIVPLSLSYDHRVIDGAAAVRFTRELARGLEGIENLLL
ncbi:MAG: 2-oxo acid dehydrogenase subunit E2 [Myxococcota bacterium]